MRTKHSSSQEKSEYNAARQWALRQMARENPERYEELMEGRLGRKLDPGARTLSRRVKTGEQRREWLTSV